MADGTVRAISDFFRRGQRAPEPDARSVPLAPADSDPVFPTQAFHKFLGTVGAREAPVLLDLGPVVGSNVTFFGERLGCKIVVEDLFADLERHAKRRDLNAFGEFLRTRMPHGDASVDGVLCWDFLDYLDRAAAQVLAARLAKMLRPGGALLGFFATGENRAPQYTKYVVVNDRSLRHRSYPASTTRQCVMLNRDISKMFEGLVVAESFLLKNKTREILFRKPAV